ncbi:MAG TPA: hypothetical protein VGG37_04220, partial [Opitutaceae bacterium]
MAAVSPALPSVADPIGGFTAEAFERHLASLSGAPAWWVERKRSAYARFASLPMPTRSDEAWRFSTLSGITLSGFAPAGQPGPAGPREALSVKEKAASLAFSGGRRTEATPLRPDLAAKGVLVTTLS